MGSVSLLSIPWVASSFALVIALCAFTAIAGIGAWFSERDCLNAWGLGLAIHGFCIGAFGLAGLPLKLLTMLLFIFGLCGLPKLLKSISNSPRKWDYPTTPWAVASYMLIAMLVLSRLLFALYPQLQADPLTYHVTSAKIWAAQDALRFIPWLPWALQGGIFEYYYTSLATIIHDPLTLLLACQASHVLFGSGLVALTVFSIVRLIGISTNTAMLVVLASILFPIDSLMMIRAKNDGITLLFSLLSLRAFFQNRRILIGIFAGAAIATKWSSLFFVLPFFTAISIIDIRKNSLKNSLINIFTMGILILGVASPIALRNWLWTENPMFPAMGQLFPSPQLNPSLIAEISKFTYSGNWYQGLIQKASWYVWAVPSVCMALLIPWVKRSTHVNFILNQSLVVLLFFAFATGTAAYPRFVLMDGVLFALCAGWVWRKFEQPSRDWFSWMILIGLLINTGIDVPISNVAKRSLPFWLYKGSTVEFLSNESPLLKFQYQINALPLSSPPIILGCHENESLFINGGQTIPSNHAGGARAQLAANVSDLSQTLVKEGFSHLLIRHDLAATCWSPYLQDSEFHKYFSLVLKDDRYALYRPQSL